MPSPLLAINEPSLTHTKPAEPTLVEVFVDDGSADQGWYPGELIEWVRYNFGWVAYVRYTTTVGNTWGARFLAEHVRRSD